MGTLGLFGFVYKGKYYLAYNHFDSYPSGLGIYLINELISAIKNNQLGNWIKMLENIKVIYELDNIVPTEEDIKKLEPYTDLSANIFFIKNYKENIA
jgi:hypothetical protein